MIGTVRTRHDFTRLGRDGVRIHSGSLWCKWCPESDTSPFRVAVAIPRRYGSAVRRNRLRRRIRAVLLENDRTSPLPGGMMLIGPTSDRGGRQIELAFDQVTKDLTVLLDRIRSSQPRGRSAPW